MSLVRLSFANALIAMRFRADRSVDEPRLYSGDPNSFMRDWLWTMAEP